MRVDFKYLFPNNNNKLYLHTLLREETLRKGIYKIQNTVS